jgi:hypothetical protein
MAGCTVCNASFDGSNIRGRRRPMLVVQILPAPLRKWVSQKRSRRGKSDCSC